MADRLLDLSDEDFLKSSVGDFTAEAPSEPADASETEKDQAPTDAQPEEKTETESSDDESDDVDSDETSGADAEDSEEPLEEADEADETEEADAVEETESEPSDDGTEESEELNDESLESAGMLAEIMAPIKAGGRTITPSNPNEVRQLIQMGVDYSDKMRAMKPHRKALKMLENNDLLDEGKLNYVIDLVKGDKGAIAKLMADSKIDADSLEEVDLSQYTPNEHTVSDNVVALDDVVDRIRNTESFSTTMAEVTNKWDEASKTAVVENPVLLEQINTHVSNGTYNSVMNEVEKARLLGGLTGLSDLEAYNKVGSMMQDRGDFNVQETQAAPSKVSTKPKSVSTTATQAKKRRVSPAKKASPVASNPNTKSVIGLSDDEFMKKYG